MARTKTVTTPTSTKTTKTTKRKRKAATNALREIRAEQTDLRFKSDAYRAMHTAAEEFLIETFQRANKCAIHDLRETVQPKDIRLARELAVNE